MDPRQQQFNLAAFTRLRWPSPALSDSPQPTSFTAAGSAIESVFLLALGEELDAYPKTQTQNLLTVSKPLISEMEKSNEHLLNLVIPESRDWSWLSCFSAEELIIFRIGLDPSAVCCLTSIMRCTSLT